ncbi:MAG TPA: class IV lanthionine synthetase LanL [Ktedonobacteraceae bacterium]|nr:class IV lanthionine synthetase LanL [Ktedonobacteraceae bacterium]
MIEPRLRVPEIETDEPDDPLVQIVREVYSNASPQNRHWRIEQSSDPLKQWLQFHTDPASLPQQGWKLHVSASASSARAVLRGVLPILFARSVAFKMAVSLKRLKFLNQGGAGRSQIGKFITVYPRNDEEALDLAALLDEATNGLSGPCIPSDHALRSGSLVYYRYGGFSNQLVIQSNIGLILPAIRTPENEILSDLRHVPYQAPPWVVDPFINAGIATEPPPFKRLLGNRYLVVAILSTSMNSTIYLGSDLEAARTCVIKGPSFAQRNNSNKPARQKIYHEAQILRLLAPDRRFPALFDVLEQDGSLFLIMEDIEGETLDVHTGKRAARGQHIPFDRIIVWSRELTEMLETIHARGLVYTDLKPSNVIIDGDGNLHLIDFELAHKQGDEDPMWRGCGTRGYMSPQQQGGQPITVRDDIYSFGALLYSLVTGAEPSYAPHPLTLLERPVESLNPQAVEALRGIIVRCLDRNPEARYPSMNALNAALTSISVRPLSVSPGSDPAQEAYEEAEVHYRELAKRLLDTLCAQARQPARSEGLAWKSAHPISYGFISRDINTGNSGTLLALAELAAEFTGSHEREILEAGTRWLCAALTKNPQPLPGLYVGESGVGAALLRAGQILHDDSLISIAAQRGRQVGSFPYGSPDLFNGTAGRLRFHLLLWDETREQEHLLSAINCGQRLLATATRQDNREVSWTIPAGYDSLSEHTYAGYAHGAAGIADALLDLFEITEDERLLPAIRGTGSWLQRLAIPALDDESGLSWPMTEGGPASQAFWCHGSAGIGQFFLHAARVGVIPSAMDIAARAARVVARGTRSVGPTQCHGLAGNIEFLLDIYQATADRSYLAETRALALLLEAFSQERDGYLVFSSEFPDTFTPDYMVGYAGIALCLLRLSAPDRLPHQLSRSGFRYRRQDS